MSQYNLDRIFQPRRVAVVGAIVISAGGKEVGEKGRAIEERIRASAYAGGLRIVGPNCLGIIRPGANLNASFASEMPDAGAARPRNLSETRCVSAALLEPRQPHRYSRRCLRGTFSPHP